MITSLGQILPNSASQFGDKCALIIGDQRFSFVKLDQLSNRLANGLALVGIEPGDRVTLFGPNSWEWIISYHAVLKLGAVINPISAMLTSEEVEYVVNDCGAKAIIAAGDLSDRVLGLKDKSGVSQIILFGKGVPQGAHSLTELIAYKAADFDVADAPTEALSTICYTSGTTGNPKGAMQSHKSVLLNVAMLAQMHVRNSSDTVVSALPCSHVYGNIVVNSALMFGMTLVLHPRFVEEVVLKSIEKHRATLLEGVPTMFLYLLNHPGFDDYDFSSLTRCTVGGQYMPVAKMHEFEKRVGCPLIEIWGMTEVGGAGTTPPLYGEKKDGSIGIGFPYLETRIAAIDDASITLPRGEVGEFMVRGPLVMQGYYGNDAATRETIEPDGWLHTGDLASMDEDGYIFIVDRKKDMILTAGYNVYPAELERVIAGHSDVAMVAVGGQPDKLKGEIAKAYIVPKEGVKGDKDSIIKFCREHLAAYKVPRAVQFVEDLPKTGSGKVMRRKLKMLDA